MRWAGYVTGIADKRFLCPHKMLIQHPEEESHFEDGRMDNTEMHLKKTGWKDVNWIQRGLGRMDTRGWVRGSGKHGNEPSRCITRREFLVRLSDNQTVENFLHSFQEATSVLCDRRRGVSWRPCLRRRGKVRRWRTKRKAKEEVRQRQLLVHEEADLVEIRQSALKLLGYYHCVFGCAQVHTKFILMHLYFKNGLQQIVKNTFTLLPLFLQKDITIPYLTDTWNNLVFVATHNAK